MQPYGHFPQPQDPRFHNGQPQPVAHPGFVVPHNNPYVQPMQPMYFPPAQYAMPMYQASQQPPTQPIQTDTAVIEAQVRQIDNELASGWWACYNCLLYALAIIGIVVVISAVSSLIAYIPALVFIVRYIIEVAYAATMIDALKAKKLDKAVLGVNLSYAAGGLSVLCFGMQVIFPMPENKHLIAPSPSMSSLIFSGVLWALIELLPAMKVKEFIQKRESLIAQSSKPLNA